LHHSADGVFAMEVDDSHVSVQYNSESAGVTCFICSHVWYLSCQM